jgi:hypothetical protein
MFIRYTHFGIGHPAMHIVSDDNEADMGREEDSDGEGEGDEGCSDDDDGEVSDEEFSDEGNEKDDGKGGKMRMSTKARMMISHLFKFPPINDCLMSDDY